MVLSKIGQKLRGSFRKGVRVCTGVLGGGVGVGFSGGGGAVFLWKVRETGKRVGRVGGGVGTGKGTAKSMRKLCRNQH